MLKVRLRFFTNYHNLVIITSDILQTEMMMTIITKLYLPLINKNVIVGGLNISNFSRTPIKRVISIL